ncbi:MAG TPA: hypothetical protein VKA35_03925 [Solirubrobacterales bacterium]|nr:hypothetical protein [Solirubrobacterales bacterium]
MAPVAIAFAVLHLNGSATDIGIVFAAHSLLLIALVRDPPVRTRVSAYDWFGSLALEPIGLAVVGPLAVAVGTSETLWLSAAAIAICLGAVYAVPSVRRLEVRVDEPTPTPPPRPIEAGD